MRTEIRRIGNSKGVILPKPFISQAGLTEDEVEMTVEGDAIVLRRPRKEARSGWAEAARSLSAAGDDGLVWPEFGAQGDRSLKW